MLRRMGDCWLVKVSPMLINLLMRLRRVKKSSILKPASDLALRQAPSRRWTSSQMSLRDRNRFCSTSAKYLLDSPAVTASPCHLIMA